MMIGRWVGLGRGGGRLSQARKPLGEARRSLKTDIAFIEYRLDSNSFRLRYDP